MDGGDQTTGVQETTANVVVVDSYNKMTSPLADVYRRDSPGSNQQQRGRNICAGSNKEAERSTPDIPHTATWRGIEPGYESKKKVYGKRDCQAVDQRRDGRPPSQAVHW